jgi:hypothetical protein
MMPSTGANIEQDRERGAKGCSAASHFALLHSSRLALSDMMPSMGANIEQARERGAKGGVAEWSPSEQPRTRGERRRSRVEPE